jgi:PAS domain S-box-containing protein
MTNTTNPAGPAAGADTTHRTGRRWWQKRLQISGIRARIIFTVSASLLAMTVVLGIITYQTMSVRLIAQQKELLRQDSQFASMQFATFLKTIRNDTLMLASQVRLGGLDAALAAEHVEEWRSVMQAKPAYGGLSVVAADGRRLLELQRNGTDVTVIPVDGTRTRLDLRDAERSLGLDAGTAWVSDIERDPDTGRPTLRVITSLTPQTGTAPQSSLVISVDIGRLRELLIPVSTISDLYARETQFFITNSAGAFISHPDRNRTLWFSDDGPWLLKDEFPDAATTAHSEGLSLLTTDNAAGASMLLASSAVRLNPDGPESVHFILALPYAVVLDAARPSTIDHLWFLCLFLLVALIANTLATRTLIQPLRRITTAIREAGTSSTLSSLPIDRQDEIGELARSFREMFLGRVTAEQQTRELALALENAAAGMVILGPEKLVRYVNPQYERQLGYSLSEVIGQRPSHGLDSPELYAELWQALDNGRKWSGRLSSRRRDGSILYEQTTIAPICDVDGSVRGYVATLLDISDLHAVEKRLQYLGAAIDSADECILILNLDNTVIYVNPAYEKQHDVRLADIAGQQPGSMHNAPEPNSNELHAMIAAVARGESWRGALSCISGRGETLVEDVSVSPIRDSKGGVTAYLIVKRDISEKLHMEQQLLRAQKLEAVGQLAAGIAHEINTPTQYVGDNIRFLKDSFREILALIERLRQLGDTATDGRILSADLGKALQETDTDYLLAEVPTAIDQSIDGVDRVSKIVRAMKDFSHPATERTPLDINRAIASTATVASNEWKYIAELQTDFDPDLPAVPVMPGDFNQVILNMIVNAAHAIGDVVGDGGSSRGTITLATRRVDDRAEIRISDTGCGMTPEVAARIFDPFFTTKAVGKGTGQGLAMAHNVVVVRHGGTIKVESTPGVGTTFIIRLPLDAPESRARGNDDSQAA